MGRVVQHEVTFTLRYHRRIFMALLSELRCAQEMVQKQAEVKQLGADAAEKQEQVNRCKQGAMVCD